MFLIRLIYASTIADEFRSGDIDKILAGARQRNEKNGITGLLCFNRKYFLQCLEGSRAAVNEVYGLIAKDRRHTNLSLLEVSQIQCRAFNDWSMAFVPEIKMTGPILLKFSRSIDFNPYEMSGEGAYQLLLSLKDYYAS